MRFVLIQIGAAVLCMSLILPAIALGERREYLFSPLSQEEKVHFEEASKVDLENDRTILRMVGASLNAETLLNNAIRPSLIGLPSRPVVANLFEDVSPMTLITERVRELEPNLFEWVGHVQWVNLLQDDLNNLAGYLMADATNVQWVRPVLGDWDSRAIFVVKEGEGKKPSMLAGTITARGGRFFRIGSNQDGRHAIFEHDLSKLPNESPPNTKRPKIARASQQIRPIQMKLSDDLPMMTVITEHVGAPKPGYLEWRGRLKDDPKSSTIIVMKERDDATSPLSIVGGIIRTRERIYRIGKFWPVPRPVPGGSPDLPIFEVDPRKVTPGQLFWKDMEFLRELKPYAACKIDVMVAYTPEAVGSSQTTDLDLEIDAAFSAANEALDRSDVHFVLNRVGKNEVKDLFVEGSFKYHDNGTIDRDLSALSYQEDDTGTMTMLHGIRDTVRADLVNLWIAYGIESDPPHNASCGKANLMETLDVSFENSAFSVVPRWCVNRMSFLHELAHNMGANHNRESFNPQPTSDERGYGFLNPTMNSSGPWGTIMAVLPPGINCPTLEGPISNPNYPYSYGCRVFIFSNPALSIDGMPAGNPEPDVNAADNHWTLNNARNTVARFLLPGVSRRCLLPNVVTQAVEFEVQ
jgi:Metallo-peptidase family M12